MEHILLIEDDENLGASLKKFVSDEGFQVTLARNITSGEEALKASDDIKLVILDWMLPDGQGVDLLRKMRSEKNLTPVIMLTARTELIDKVLGLESGANDYMTKPFEPRELVARIRVQLREKKSGIAQISSEDEELTLDDLTLDLGKREVRFKGNVVEFTKMEFDFLRLLMGHPNRAFSRDEILNKVWGYEHFPSTRTVDTHVLQIRQKLDERMIETVRGIGYRFVHPLK